MQGQWPSLCCLARQLRKRSGLQVFYSKWQRLFHNHSNNSFIVLKPRCYAHLYGLDLPRPSYLVWYIDQDPDRSLSNQILHHRLVIYKNEISS